MLFPYHQVQNRDGMGQGGFEPPTFALSERRHDQSRPLAQ